MVQEEYEHVLKRDPLQKKLQTRTAVRYGLFSILKSCIAVHDAGNFPQLRYHNAHVQYGTYERSST